MDVKLQGRWVGFDSEHGEELGGQVGGEEGVGAGTITTEVFDVG